MGVECVDGFQPPGLSPLAFCFAPDNGFPIGRKAIQVFENEYIKINTEENLSKGETKIIFGDEDEFIIAWDNQ